MSMNLDLWWFWETGPSKTQIMACPTLQHVMYAARILTIEVQLLVTREWNNLERGTWQSFVHKIWWPILCLTVIFSLEVKGNPRWWKVHLWHDTEKPPPSIKKKNQRQPVSN